MQLVRCCRFVSSSAQSQRWCEAEHLRTWKGRRTWRRRGKTNANNAKSITAKQACSSSFGRTSVHRPGIGGRTLNREGPRRSDLFVAPTTGGDVLNVARRPRDVLKLQPPRSSAADASTSSLSDDRDGPSIFSIALPTACCLPLCNICRICMSIAVLKAAAEFGWSDTMSGLIQSAFLWGYMATQLLGGILADSLGGKVVMACSVAWFSLATALTPIAAGLGQVPLLLVRALVGLGEGVALPSMNNLIGKNVPVDRRATALGISFAGFHSGNILGLLLSPYLIANYGWRSLFYVFGLLGAPVLLLWQQVVPSSESLESGKGEKGPSIPISKLLSSTSAWAIFVANFVNHWGYFIYLSWLPTYFNRQFSLDIAKSSIFSLLPWLVMAVCSSLSGFLADYLIRKNVRVKNVRKILQCTSFLGTASTLLVISHPLGNRLEVAVPLFMLALGMKALGQAGFVANMSDIAAQSAGKLFGLSNTLGSFAGILSVSISGYILEKTGSFTTVFQVTAVMYIMAALLFFLLCDDKSILQQKG